MAKICKKEGCKNPVWGGGYCKYHQVLRDNYNGFKKRSTNLRTHTPINKISSSQASKNAVLSAFKANLIKEHGKKCFFHQREFPGVDLFHIFPKGSFPQYATKEWNLILSCRECNRVWDQGTIEEILTLPNVYWVLLVVKIVDPGYYERILTRNNRI